MGLLKIDNVTHWSIPVNDLEEAEQFYRDVLGLEYQGRLGNSNMACVTVAEHAILLCQRKEPLVRTPEQDNRLHHSFTVSPEVFDMACKLFRERGIRVVEIIYREHGFFPGREMYFLDPSGNLLELPMCVLPVEKIHAAIRLQSARGERTRQQVAHLAKGGIGLPGPGLRCLAGKLQGCRERVHVRELGPGLRKRGIERNGSF